MKYVPPGKDAVHSYSIILEKGEQLPLEKTYKMRPARKLGLQTDLTIELFEVPDNLLTRRWVSEEGMEFLKQEMKEAADLSLSGLKPVTMPLPQEDAEEVIKENSSKTVTAVFGTHVTMLDRECLGKYPELNCIIRHEPELTSRELARAIQDEKSFDEIAGLTFRSADNEIKSNPSRPFIDDVDQLPHPAWHLIDTNLYRLPFSGERFLIIAPLRSCPFNCSFCTFQTYYGKKLRKGSVKSVIKEIEYDMVRYNVRNFFVWAETFVVDK